MFFAQLNENPEVATFLTILNAYLAGEEKFKTIVNSVLAAAVEVAAGQRDIFQVDRQFASTSIHLNACCKELLIEISGREASREELGEIASKMKPQELVL